MECGPWISVCRTKRGRVLGRWGRVSWGWAWDSPGQREAPQRVEGGARGSSEDSSEWQGQGSEEGKLRGRNRESNFTSDTTEINRWLFLPLCRGVKIERWHLVVLKRALLLKLSVLPPSSPSSLQSCPHETLNFPFGKQSHREVEYHAKLPAGTEDRRPPAWMGTACSEAEHGRHGGL